MNLSIVDIIILMIILLGGVIGFKEGVIKKLTSIIGLILVVILSFVLKNYLSVIFYENLPFFNFFGLFKGVQVLNIIFYEVLSFVLISTVLSIIYRLLLTVTGIIEKVLKATIILSIPSKILGFIVGILEYYIWVLVILFILNLPMFRIKDINNSKVANFILKDTPIVSKYTNKVSNIYNDIYDTIDNRGNKSNAKVNEEALDIMLKYDIITVKSVDKLIDKDKISLDNTNFIDKYR